MRAMYTGTLGFKAWGLGSGVKDLGCTLRLKGLFGAFWGKVWALGARV